MPALPIFITVVPMSPLFPLQQVLWAVSALNKQIVRDFGPIWEVAASVDVALTPETVTPGKWKIALVENIKQGGLSAFHGWVGEEPYALVEYSPTWTISLSHECLEMLADPFMRRTVPGQSLATNQGRVNYLLEVCDPSQSDAYAYPVDGVKMSDFYTPNYFDPVYAPGVRYSFVDGSIPRPRNVPPGGYLSWHEPVSNTWWQYDNMGTAPQIVPMLAPQGVLARKEVDRMTLRRERAFWKRRHAKLPRSFQMFDYSFFNGNDDRAKKLLKAIKSRKKRRK